MPAANTGYYGDAGNGYDDYDTMSESSHNSEESQWKNGTNGVHTNGNNHQETTYDTPIDERASYQISMNSRPAAKPQDEVSKHMLYETALIDCKSYEVLTMEAVDALKKELARLIPRIDATYRKLALESKVRDAAQNLQKLDSRADTPQSPGRTRRSLLGQRESTSSVDGTGQHTDTELATSQKKIEELNEAMKSLLNRRAQVECSLLRHTAAILASEREQEHVLGSSRHRSYDEDAVSEYEPDEFDGIRDILGGKTINKLSKRVNPSRIQEQHEQQLHSMQSRLEHLNTQLRHVIADMSQSRGASLSPEMSQALSDDPTTQLNQDLARLENNVAILEQEQKNNTRHLTQIQASHASLGAVGSQLENVNNNLHQTLLNAPAARDLERIPQPPQGGDHQQHIGYLQGILESVESLFQAHHEDRDALAKHAGSSQKLDEYEATVGGLWDILSADEPKAADEVETSRSPKLPESFSLPAFSSRVQHIFDRATAARDQQNILLRQIQQQRELNARSDTEKDKQLVDLQGDHQTVLAAHEELQNEYARTLAKHESTESEATQLRVELANVENEFEQLRKIADGKQQEHQDMARQLQTHQANHEQAQEQLAALTSARSSKDKEMQDMESEVIRLTTELAMAKAELDGAYGSRAERAREAQAGEVEGLKDRAGTLEKELAEMTSEFQEMTRESLELERERSLLDTTIDGLRERCESLEAQLADERVRWLGIKASGTGEQQAREQTSMTVMRSEFKKMVRDARVEGVKLLRAEQEQRRTLEAELRRLRQANTPLRKPLNDASAVP